MNWGGFDGYHRIELATDSTLIAGPTGSGKSTILDAYTALMMPSTVAFNSASNQASGRPRGEAQRTLLTYLRGKLASRSADAHSGRDADRVLRGEDSAVWGGIAMTFVSDDEQRFTALRVYVAPRDASHARDVVMRLFTIDGKPRLDELDGLQGGNFRAQSVKTKLPGIDAYTDNYVKFSQQLFTRLGIGAGGDGEKALKLLAKLQAGQQPGTVDGLFKEMVLDEPTTYAHAEQALDHFERLDKSYRDLETDAKQERILAPIAELYAAYDQAQQHADQLDKFGVSLADADPTPFALWRVRAEAELVDRAVALNRDAREQNKAARGQADVQVAEYEARLQDAERQRRENGGDLLETLNARLALEEAEARQAEQRRAVFDDRTRPLGVQAVTREIYEELRQTAVPFLDTFAERESELTDQLVVHAGEIKAQRDLKHELEEEHESLLRRTGLVPVPYDRARRQIAEACGLQPDDLPFAAELMDVPPEHARWRLAAEVTLRGIGLTMLMDEHQQAHIREHIDQLHLDRRIRFDGVNLSDRRAEPPDPRYISGRLVFRTDSPFTWWVQRRVYEEDHLCVDSPEQLGGDDARKVTVYGQTSDGKRGAHGRDPNQRDILGFSNEARRREIEQQVHEIVARLNALAQEEEATRRALARHRAKREAYQCVLDQPWEQIDTHAAHAKVRATRAERDALLAASDLLAELEQLIEQLKSDVQRALAAREKLIERNHELNDEHAALVEREDELQDEQAALQAITALGADDQQYLATGFAEFLDGEELGHGRFRSEAGRFRRSLRDEITAQRQLAESKAGQLTGVFERYQAAWPDPNRGTRVESYGQYAAIYEHITRHGLFERKERFKREVASWTGRDLLQLNDSFEVAVANIEERLDPINDILANLPFGPGRDRLRIVVRRLSPERLTTFRHELRFLASHITADLTDELAEERFLRLRVFMDRLRQPANVGQVAYRDEVLDVRRHIEITARCFDATGEEVSTFAALGDKSGGESQELVAFIVGAALRFQLGDETRSKPRFAPVMLDEGFIKADGEFAHRAVNAWGRLGFQLILAVPLDKVTALEPHVDLRLGVAKTPSGRSQIYTLEAE